MYHHCLAGKGAMTRAECIQYTYLKPKPGTEHQYQMIMYDMIFKNEEKEWKYQQTVYIRCDEKDARRYAHLLVEQWNSVGGNLKAKLLG